MQNNSYEQLEGNIMGNTSIRKAVMINFVGKYSNILLGLVYSAILSRFLEPKDFGVVAVVTVFTSFFSLLANMGIGPAIIQNRELSNNDVNNIYSYTVYIGLLIGIAFSLFSIPLSMFYGDSVYIPIGILLSISLFFNTVNIVPNAILLKEHRFKLVNMRLVSVTIITAIPTLIMANFGFKYYSIVLHSILVSFVKFIWNYFTVKPQFHFRVDSDSIKKIRSFSSFQMGFSVINYFSRNLDNLLIGRFIGSEELGYYDKSYRLMLYPVNNLTHVITPVLHPILSASQFDKDKLFNQYKKVINILSVLGVFVSAFSFFAAEEIILIMYGNQWGLSVISFRYLALSIWAQMITSSTGSIFQSIGNTKLLFKTGLLSSALQVSSILIGVLLGDINSVALFITIGYNINFFITFFMLIKIGLGKSLVDFYKGFLPDIFNFIITFGAIFVVSQFRFDSLFISFSTKLVIGSLVYCTTLFFTKRYKILLMAFGRKKKKTKVS